MDVYSYGTDETTDNGCLNDMYNNFMRLLRNDAFYVWRSYKIDKKNKQLSNQAT